MLTKKGGPKATLSLAIMLNAVRRRSIPTRDAAVTGARSIVMLREADASVPTVCRALLVLEPARGRVNFLAIHIQVMAVVAAIGKSIAWLANEADK